MLDKLAQIETRYEELTNELSSPELLSNPSAYGKAAKQHRSLGEVVEKYRAWKSLNATWALPAPIKSSASFFFSRFAFSPAEFRV